MVHHLKQTYARIIKSFGYSWSALRTLWKNEQSFRLEIIAFAIIILILALSSWPLWKKLGMMASYLLIPLLEIVNTAVEDVCNLITREPSQLVRSAKDKGALAVLVAILFNILVLGCLLVH